MGLPAVDNLGFQLEKAWSTRNHDPDCFPDLCVEHLAAARLHDQLTPAQIIDWALEGNLPEQVDPRASFGQPPITLFRSRRFFVAALHWLDGTTAIHDHAFCGAFQLLSGSSIESTFAFRTERNVGDHLRLGALEVLGARLVSQGDVHPIVAGPSFIHSLFHLPRPSVSLVVRTFSDPRPGIQLAYLPPGIAHNAFFSDETLDRMVQVVQMLRKLQDPTLVDRVGAVIARSDLHTAFAILKECTKMTNRAALEQLVDRVRDRQAAALFSVWIAEEERLAFLRSRRSAVHDADLRFLLAVLLNLHRRADALSLVASYAPGIDPARQIASWLNKLSTITMKLQTANGLWEPSLLGLPPFTARLEELLASELRGDPLPHTDEESAFLARLRALPALAPLFR